MPLNVEIKARCTFAQRAKILAYLQEHGAFKGVDSQEDIYFKVPKGRLKLRSGPIENYLVQYDRPDYAGAKTSKFRLFPACQELKEIMLAALDVLVVVNKNRHIYFIDNVKVHVDSVVGLGEFVEIEAKQEFGAENKDVDFLEGQCKHYMEVFEIKEADLITCSYSDLLTK